MQRQLTKKIFSIFLTLGFNLALWYFTIFLYASYYTPGNPIRPSRIEIDIIGLIGFYVGISQAFYLVPILFLLAKWRRQALLEGVILGAVITILLNFVFLVTF